MHHDTNLITDLIPLTQLSAALHNHGVHKNYGQCWRAANEGQFPVMRAGGRLFVSSSNLKAIAETFTPADG